MTEQQLTNEALKGICRSSFDRANYAINLGRYFIKSGRETSLAEVVRELKRHPDPNYLETLKEIDRIEWESEQKREGHGAG